MCDAVRLLLMGEASEMLSGVEREKVYFEITSIDYYAKGSSGKARKFRGRAMDTYWILTPDRFVSAGDEIAFQRRNIIEVPGWHLDSFGMAKGAVAQQSNLAAMKEDRRRIDERYTAYKRECEKKTRVGKAFGSTAPGRRAADGAAARRGQLPAVFHVQHE